MFEQMLECGFIWTLVIADLRYTVLQNHKKIRSD